jgi:hypothetical protein
MINIDSFTKMLQLSISPIGLISGAGLLLLSITNRLARSIDRSRDIADGVGKSHSRENDIYQLKVLLKRSALLRNSVFFTGFSIFLSTLIILGLFLRLFLGWPCESAVLIFLFLSVACLCLSMVFFLIDVSLALKALKVEVDKHLD